MSAALDHIKAALQAGELFGSSLIPRKFEPTVTLTVTYEAFGGVTPGSTYSTDETSEEPEISFSDTAATAAGTQDHTYTVVMADPDAPSKENPEFSPFRHWIVADVVPGQEAGKTLTTYMGPAPPPKTGRHRYVFLLFKQTHGTPTLGDAGDERPKFAIDDFVKSNDLKLVGATYYFAANKEQ